MAKESKRYGSKFIVVELLLLVLIGVSLFIWFYFNDKKSSLEKDYKNDLEEYNLKKEEYDAIVKESDELTNKLKVYDNLDESIKTTKEDYFKTIKELEDKIISGESNKKIAYLTFDDGPYYNTYKVLDILDRYNVKATFFTTNINGDWCYDNKKENCFKLYKEYLNHGHTIANHTYTHGIWRGLYKSVDSFMDALVKQEEHIKEQSGGYVTNIMRFPGGSNTAGKLKDGIIEKARAKGYGWVDWTAQDGDGGSLSSTTEAWSNFKSSINQNIEVVLFHDYSPITTAILPDVIEYLQNNGYILLQLFYDSNMINK